MLPLALPPDSGANTVLNVTLAPGLSVIGTFSPPMLNPVPATVACRIVTLAPPVLVRVSIKVRLAPTWTLPKFKLPGLPVSWPAPTPVPVKETVAVLFEFGEPLPRDLFFGTEHAKERLPVMLPPDCGAKVVVRLTLCPGASIAGTLSPLKLNPVPASVAWEIVRFELAVLVRTTGCDTLLPI
jgi:hypothetical protein